MASTQYKREPASIPSPCIWMQAGIVRRKFCRKDYDCPECGFDIALRRVAEENRKLIARGKTPKKNRHHIIFWKDKLKELPSRNRPCIHHLKKRINFKSCNHEYRCGNCEFDQFFQDQYTVHAVVKPVDVLDIEGFRVPQGFYLHRGHTWVKIEGGCEVRVGIDDFASRVLGPMDRIEAPLMGKQIQKGRNDFRINRGSHAAALLSPVSGVITAINPKLREEGAIANQHPYAEGWMARVHADNLRQDLKDLMIADESEGFLREEVDRLYEVIESEAGPLSADGGQLGNDIYGNLPQIGWKNLVNLFLRT
ncbi:glycine cleavage system protein H [Thermodesulfobacteriota bacterium]